MKEFGNVNPILIDDQRMLIAGHGRLEAAKCLRHEHVPSIMAQGLSEAKKRALRLADNKIAANAEWDRGILKQELEEFINLDDFAIERTGFEPPEIDQLLLDMEDNSADPADICPDPPDDAISRQGDLWLLGEHLFLCGDARDDEHLNRLCGAERVTLNALLSFAQFEREVTAERIRDKAAASKKMGIWMGGNVPFGYRSVEGKLVVDEQEARSVRWLFARYLDLRSLVGSFSSILVWCQS